MIAIRASKITAPFAIVVLAALTVSTAEKQPQSGFLKDSSFPNYPFIPSAIPAALAAPIANSHGKEDEQSLQEALKQKSAGHPDRAIQILNAAIEKNSSSEPLHTLRADLRSEERNHEGAVADLNQSITLNPQKVELFNKRARILLRVSQLQGAEYDINHALKLQPGNNEAITLRGGLYFKLDRYDKALKDLNAAISKDKKNSLAYFYRGAVKFKTKEYKAAIADYTTAIDLDPTLTYAYHSRGCAYGEMGDYKSALADFNKATQRKNGTPHIYFNRGRVYRLMKDYKNAISDYTMAIRYGLAETDSTVPVFLERAMSYLGLGRAHQAMIDVNHYLKTHPRDARGYLLRAQIHKQVGNVQAELKDVAKAKELGATVSGVIPRAPKGSD
jgi:tetratricopeptide (TPR) repeat protein